MASIRKSLRPEASRVSTKQFFLLASNPVPNHVQPQGFKRLLSLGNSVFAQGLLCNAYLHLNSRRIVICFTVIRNNLSAQVRDELIEHGVKFIENLMQEFACDMNQLCITGYRYGASLAEYVGMLMSLPVVSFDSRAKEFENIEARQYCYLTRYFLNQNGHKYAKHGSMFQIKSQQPNVLLARWQQALTQHQQVLPESVKQQTFQDNWLASFAANGEPIHCE
ncbi:MAG: hypothetical protein AAGG80_07150, partial [Pseudomonadota bacterium]